MKTMLILLGCLLFLAQPVVAQDRPNEDTRLEQGRKPGRTNEDILRAIYYRLEKLNDRYIEKLQNRDQKKAQELLSEIEYDLKMLEMAIMMPPPPPPPFPMPPEAFYDFMKALRKESFDSDKKQMLMVVAQGEYFTVDQLLMVTKEFMMDSDKKEVVRILFPAVVDKYNAYKILQAFTFSSDKEEIRKIIEAQGK